MGTRARILVVGEPSGLVDRLRDRILDLEARWSRFVDTSEISRLNRAAGAAMPVSADTFGLLTHAVEGWEATYGLFDPTVLGDLERAGYDRSFEHLAGPDPLDSHLARHPSAAGGWSVPPADAPSPSWRVRGCGGLELDPTAGTARLPAGVGFDPGGIGKGFAADLVAAEAMEAGAAGVLVDLGGDLRVSGVPPERHGDWRIGVDHPTHALDLATVHLADGAVATSTRTRRRWTTPAGDQRHHLIDPLLGSPVDRGVLSATAVAATGWQAEVLAKAAFIGGPVQGLGLVHTLGGAALVVDADGAVTEGSDWHRFAARAA